MNNICANTRRKFVPPSQEEEPEKYQSHFSSYVEADVEPDSLEDLYKEV